MAALTIPVSYRAPIATALLLLCCRSAPAVGQLVPDQAQLLSEENDPPYGPPEPLGGLGAVLASGDFNGDGYDDLAMGRPSPNFTSEPGR